MSSTLNALKKVALPSLALLATLAVILQARGIGGKGPGLALAGLGGETAHAVTPAAPRASTLGAAGSVSAEGRLVTYPGGEVVIGTDLAGTVVRLLVQEKQRVRKGEAIAELRADDLRASIDEARAQVAQAEADIRFADVDLERADRLVAAKVGTQEAADRARSQRDAAYARKETALASVSRLRAVLAKTRLTAPIDGVVIVRHADAGEHLEAGAPLVTIADLSRTRIEAEVDEFDAGRVALGSPVKVTAEGYSGETWEGTIEEIPDAVVGRRLKPQDPGRPSDTRVLLVKVALREKTPLKLGQRVELEIGGS